MLSWKVSEKKITLGDLILIALVIGLAVAVLLSLGSSVTQAATAEIQVDGTVVQTLDLSQSGTVVLDQLPYPLTLEIANNAISVSHANCPGEDCKSTGWISGEGQQIICLPNHLVISLVGGEEMPFDAVLG